jgi:tRNA G18 (ribose-2'-O)-methylase SpoU
MNGRWSDWLDAIRHAPAGNGTPVLGLLDNVRSAWNVGSMFRSADAAGLAGLVLCGMTATPPRPDIEKTALGASLTVPWDYWSDTVDCAAALRKAGLPLVVLETAPTAAPFDEGALPFPHCFAVGHEVDGVNRELLADADRIVTIPMAGSKSSLNVAVSFGIMAFEARRQWRAWRAARAGEPR